MKLSGFSCVVMATLISINLASPLSSDKNAPATNSLLSPEAACLPDKAGCEWNKPEKCCSGNCAFIGEGVDQCMPKDVGSPAMAVRSIEKDECLPNRAACAWDNPQACCSRDCNLVKTGNQCIQNSGPPQSSEPHCLADFAACSWDKPEECCSGICALGETVDQGVPKIEEHAASSLKARGPSKAEQRTADLVDTKTHCLPLYSHCDPTKSHDCCSGHCVSDDNLPPCLHRQATNFTAATRSDENAANVARSPESSPDSLLNRSDPFCAPNLLPCDPQIPKKCCSGYCQDSDFPYCKKAPKDAKETAEESTDTDLTKRECTSLYGECEQSADCCSNYCSKKHLQCLFKEMDKSCGEAGDPCYYDSECCSGTRGGKSGYNPRCRA